MNQIVKCRCSKVICICRKGPVPFERGKFYMHTSGKTLFICGPVSSVMFGETLIAEVGGTAELVAVGKEPGATMNYTETSREEFMKGYS